MQVIDVRSIITKSGLGIEETAFKLFPEHKNPYKALKRVMDGDGQLKAEEIARLSQITGFEISSLFNPKIWDVEASATEERQILRMRSGEFVAELDMSTLMTAVVKIGSSHISSFLVSPDTPFSEYLQRLTFRISNM